MQAVERVLVRLGSIARRQSALRKLAARSFLRLLCFDQLSRRLLIEVPLERRVLRWVVAAV